MFRFAVRSLCRRARDLYREEVLVTRSEMLGDVHLVREEVALGLAEIAAVDPHVAQVEDTVEHEPAARALARPSG